MYVRVPPISNARQPSVSCRVSRPLTRTALRPPRLCQQEASPPASQLSGAWLAAGRAVVEDELVRACVGNAPAHQPCHVINVSAPRHILYHVDRDSSERGEEKTLRSATRPQRDGGGLTEARGVAALDGHARDGATGRDRLRRNPTLPTATHARQGLCLLSILGSHDHAVSRVCDCGEFQR